MKINVVIIDDDNVTRRHLFDHLDTVAKVTLDDEVITCTRHEFPPVYLPADPTKVDFKATLKKAKTLEPGVAIIDLKLEGDAEDDYSGANLALRLKETCNDCCIILVSHYFDAAPRLLDSIEIFRFRVDRNHMSYGEELRERFTEAVRHNVAATALRCLLNTQVTLNQQLRKPPSRSVYISYACNDKGDGDSSREAIVKRIVESLVAKGYDVRRDKTSLGYTGLISAFMKEIGCGGCVIVVLSEKYLHSKYCMYELLEVHRNQDFHKRICPIALSDAQLSNLATRINYVNYWSSEFDQLQKFFKKIKPVYMAIEQLEDLHRYRDISINSGRLLEYLADMNHLTIDEIEKDDFLILRKRIDQCIFANKDRNPAVGC